MDVTDLKRERDRAQRYLDIAGTMILVLDSAGRVSLVNRRVCDLLGWSEEELVGRDWFEVAVPHGTRLATRAPSIGRWPARPRFPSIARTWSSQAAGRSASSPGTTRCCATSTGA